MIRNNSRLFESGGDSIKRDLLAQFAKHSEDKKHPNYEIQGHSIVMTEQEMLKEQLSKLLFENKQLKEEILSIRNVERESVGLQCDELRTELLQDIINQKDESISHYERQIGSFKQMILNKNEQLKELMNKFDQLPNTIPQKQQPIITQSFSDIETQTDTLNYFDLTQLSEDAIYKEIQQYKNIMLQYEMEIKQLKLQSENNKQLENKLNIHNQSIQQSPCENSNYSNNNNNEPKQLQKELAIYKQQYQETLDNYYFLQSESRSDQKKIKELTEELERIKSNTEPSVSSTETVTSPRETPQTKQGLKKTQLKINTVSGITKNIYINPQNLDEIIRLEDQNTKMTHKQNEYKQQMMDLQKQIQNLVTDNLTKEQTISQLQQKIQNYQHDFSAIEVRFKELEQCEEQYKAKEKLIQDKFNKIQGEYLSVQSDCQGLKIINQQLHNKIEKLQKK